MRSILVPSDFSSNAAAALKYAIQLSNQMGVSIMVYHCFHLSGVAITMPAIRNEAMLNNMIFEDEAKKKAQLTQFVKEVYQSTGLNEIPATTSIVVEFNPMLAEALIACAKNHPVDLIVMGTHGATGIKKFFFGSNTSNIISKSTIPVLAIPETHNHQPVRNICLCSDLENFKEELNQLLPFVTALKATLDILYFDYGKDPLEKLIHAAKATLKNISHPAPQLLVQKANYDQSLVKQIKNYLVSSNPDCLVMFTRERTLWDRLFLGSKTEDMSESLQVPLLSLKKRLYW